MCLSPMEKQEEIILSEAASELNGCQNYIEEWNSYVSFHNSKITCCVSGQHFLVIASCNEEICPWPGFT